MLHAVPSPRSFFRAVTFAAVLAAVGATAPGFAQDDDPPPQAGRLSYMRGNVSVEPAGAQDWGQAYPNLAIGPGDRFYTDANSRAEIQVGRTFVRLGPNSDVTLVDYSPNQVTFGVGRGSIHVRSLGLWQGQYLSVQTPSGTNTVNEPSDFRVDVYPDEPAAVFTENAGNGYVAGADDFGVSLPAGQSLELAGTNPVQSQWLQPGYDDLDQWSRSRDSQVERSASYRYVSPDIDGAYDLDQAGDWTPGTEYGNIWFPHVQQGWQPYHNGHWINRDPWGWVWVEDEPWGYAPFHYGRWVNYQGRWGWIPGPREARPIWSPALVVFAVGVGGGEMSAWFPLGPGEAYRPWYPASQRYIDQVNISNIAPAPRVQVRNTYVNITNVNVTNITYVNQSTGVTAVPRQAFESGRPVAQAAVHVTPQQMQHVQVMTKPPVAAPPHPVIVHPVAKPVQVAEARPVLINSKGMAVAAKPHAQPAPPPVRQAPPAAAQPPAGRQPAAAPPPNVKMTPTAQKSMQAAAAQHANQPAGGRPGAPAQQPNQPNQSNRPDAPQGAPQKGTPAGQPGHPATAAPAPAPAPGRPQAETPARPAPEPQHPAQPIPPARPGQPMPPARPAPEPQRPVQPMPPARPAPEPQRPTQPMPPARPSPEPERPMPPARPAPEPQRPGQPMPPARPAPEPQRPTQPMPPARPSPEPERPMPPAHPGPEPQHPAQPMPPARPAPEPQRPVQPMPPARPAPEPQRPMPQARPMPEPQRPAPEARPAPPPSRPTPEPQRPAPRPNDKEKEKPKPQ